MIRQRLAIRVTDSIERNLPANIAIRLDCEIIQRPHYFRRVVDKVMWWKPTVIIGKADGVNKMPRLGFRKMLEYCHLMRTIQCTDNQIIILAQNFYFIAPCF